MTYAYIYEYDTRRADSGGDVVLIMNEDAMPYGMRGLPRNDCRASHEYIADGGFESEDGAVRAAMAVAGWGATRHYSPGVADMCEGCVRVIRPDFNQPRVSLIG